MVSIIIAYRHFEQTGILHEVCLHIRNILMSFEANGVTMIQEKVELDKVSEGGVNGGMQ